MKPTLYPNGFPSAYEELKTFYPVFYRDVFEMDAIWRVCGGGLDIIEANVDAVANSTFISLMDEAALALMEVFLGVPSDPSRSIEDRRKLVSSYFLGTGHIGAPEIKEITRAFTEGQCEVAFEGGAVYIHIKAEITDTPPADDYFYILRKKIPAHLGVNTELEIEFNENLYVGSNALQSDRYTVGPELPKPQSAEGTVYTGNAVMQSDHYTVEPHPQPGLSFETGLFAASAMAAFARTTVQPKAPEELAVEAALTTRTGVIENARISVDLTLEDSQLEATDTARVGCGIVENTHYIVQAAQEGGT